MSAPTIPKAAAVPPLVDGERLGRAEFERRYDAMPGVKAELIEGVVSIAPPVKHRAHGVPHSHAIGWLGLYCDATPGVDGADNSTIRLDAHNMTQPDILLYVQPEHGGTLRFSEDDLVESAPELIVEIAADGSGNELTSKLRVYGRNSVREYVVWRTLDRAVDWFTLVGGEYVRQAIHADGLYRSEVFPGLWLDPSALIHDDRPRMLAVNSLGTATPEHAAFVDRLRRAARPSDGV